MLPFFISPLMHLVFRLAHQHLAFRIPELLALINLFKLQGILELHLDSKALDRLTHTPILHATLHHPQHLPTVITLAARSIATRALYHIIASANSRPALIAAVRALPLSSPHCPLTPLLNLSFYYTVDSFLKKYTTRECREIIGDFSFLPLQGHIDFENPEVTYTILAHGDSTHGEW
jgi:hypothetical protein